MKKLASLAAVPALCICSLARARNFEIQSRGSAVSLAT